MSKKYKISFTYEEEEGKSTFKDFLIENEADEILDDMSIIHRAVLICARHILESNLPTREAVEAAR